jgi:hypothetical protein
LGEAPKLWRADQRRFAACANYPKTGSGFKTSIIRLPWDRIMPSFFIELNCQLRVSTAIPRKLTSSAPFMGSGNTGVSDGSLASA